MAQQGIILFGTPEFAVPSLEALVSGGFSVAAAVTAPDKPTGRKQVLSSSPVKRAAQSRGIPVFEPVSLKDKGFFKTFSDLDPTVCIIAAYGKIIPEYYLAVPKFGFINTHPSLLPKYRGSSPIQTAIMEGETEMGVSIMLLDKEVDHGPILAAASYKLQATSYFPEVAKDLAELGAQLLAKTLPRYLAGEIVPKEQDHAAATFTKMLKWEDGKIDWDRPTERIFNQIRALNPEPGTWTTWKGKTLRVIKAHALSGSLKAGEAAKTDNSIAVGTATIPLALDLIQLEGKSPTAPQDFINGHPDFIGTTLR